MKCTIAITQQCNLRCSYCYIEKKPSRMSIQTAQRIVNFIFDNSAKYERVEIGFFGGEPLLEFDLLEDITKLIQEEESFDPQRFSLAITSNGTIFNQEIANYLKETNVILNISCDGPAEIQDTHRRFSSGDGTSKVVEGNIKKIISLFPLTPVNAVYSPENLDNLPNTVKYLSSIGVRNIYLSPNISANWIEDDFIKIPQICSEIGRYYNECNFSGKPLYINMIDGKIAVILRGGYQPADRCKMGNGEYAFAPSGNIYPCERFIGSDDGKTHCIGNINNGFEATKSTCIMEVSSALNVPCKECGIKDYCMNWCGCTNFFSTGHYNLVSPFICALEKGSITTALKVIQESAGNGMDFSHHLDGTLLTNVVWATLRNGERLT